MPTISLWRRPGAKILASKSPIRRQILEAVGLPVEIRSATVDERQAEARHFSEGGNASDLAIALASRKALAASAAEPAALCLAADQTLTLGDRVVHKSETRNEAAQTLRKLSGRAHRLTSAVAVALDGRLAFVADDRAEMRMRPLDAGEIEHYLEVAGPPVLASVGVYQIEALGPHLFERIEGDHATILGLPLMKLLVFLRDEGWMSL